MSTIEERREEFREYLEKSGVVDALTAALVKLYEEPEKPECAVKFVRHRMCETAPTEEQYDELKTKFDETVAKNSDLKRKLRSAMGNIKRTQSEVFQMLDEGMQKLEEDENCTSLLKKFLSRDIFDQLKEVRTETFKSTLLDCIQSGLENHDSGCGIYAPDADAYTDFAVLFDPIIEDYHMEFDATSEQPQFDWGHPSEILNIDPDNKYIVSTRVRCGRSLEGYPFNPKMTEEQYEEIMTKVREILENMEDEYKGTFYPLEGMDKELQQKLIDDHFLFKEGDRFQESARATRFWPVGRAIYLNDDKTFLVWVNEEDHLRFISMQSGGDLGTIYRRLIEGVDIVAEHLPFARHERLGYLTFCPTNLGTTIRASVHIRLPKLVASDRLQELADQYRLQVRGTSGEHTESVGGVYDISNKRRLGLTEFEAVKELYDGITAIIKAETELEDEAETPTTEETPAS